ncbi:MAG: hypothetical protein ACLFT2_04830 [Candidatus Brocadiia bacterium]
MTNIINFLVETHASADWVFLVQVYGGVLAFVIFIILLLRQAKVRSSVAKMAERFEVLEERMNAMSSSLENAHSDLSKQVEETVMQKVNSRTDAVEKRVQEVNSRQSENLDDRASELSTRISELEAEIRAFDRHLDKMEKRMPSVFDRLEDFQRALTKGYQNELSNVFDSFDNAVGAVLDQMKNELQTSLNRIDGIEDMVDKRRRAEDNFGMGEPENEKSGEDDLPPLNQGFEDVKREADSGDEETSDESVLQGETDEDAAAPGELATWPPHEEVEEPPGEVDEDDAPDETEQTS